MNGIHRTVKQKLQATKRSHRWLVSVAALLVAVPLLLPTTGSAYAPCTATITPDTFAPANEVNISFSIDNGSGAPFTWIQVVRPSADYDINGSSVSGWSDATGSNGTTLTGGTLTDGNSFDFQLAAMTGIGNTNMAAWQIKASANADGSDPIDCTGPHSTAIQGDLQDSGNFSFSNVAVTAITSTSATISWDTDSTTSAVVYYGTDLPYSKNTSPDTNLDTSHQQTLTGLSPDTTYHFQLGGADQNGSVGASSDNTFLTLPSPASGGGNKGGSGSGSGGTGSQTQAPGSSKIVSSTDKIAPVIDIATKLQASYKAAPTITGSASDNEGIAKVEYSTDGGQNWIAVDSLPNAGKKATAFSFTPIITQEGNYSIVARATDLGGNTTTTTTRTLVIDILPPIVGTSTVAVGSQTVQPDDNGTFVALVGVDQTMTVSAVGGPISITISAVRAGIKEPAHNFSLSYSAQANLWRGALSFQQAGTYQLVANAIDGAGNTTKRDLNTITVIPAATFTDMQRKLLKQAVVTVYERDRDTEAWTEWNGEAYGQDNPSTSATGTYGYYLPPGTYYLSVRAHGHQTVTTNSFTVTRPAIMATNITMPTLPGITIAHHRYSLPLPNLKLAHVSLNSSNNTTATTAPIVQQQTTLPKFSLPASNGETYTPASFFKKPLVLSVISTWAPQAQDQIAILDSIHDTSANFVGLAMGEDVARLTAYTKLAGYNLPIIADQNNQLMPTLQPAGLPTNYFFDRHGVVKKVMVGVLSKEELLKNVQN